MILILFHTIHNQANTRRTRAVHKIMFTKLHSALLCLEQNHNISALLYSYYVVVALSLFICVFLFDFNPCGKFEVYSMTK